jgi:hypothetical protein
VKLNGSFCATLCVQRICILHRTVDKIQPWFLEMNQPAESDHAKGHPVSEGVDVPEGSGEVAQLHIHLTADSGQVLKSESN